MRMLQLDIDHIPLKLFSIIRLDKGSKQTGFLIPDRADMPPLWVESDGEGVMILPLGGQFAFRHFRLQAGSPIRGIIFKDVEIAVDVSSKLNHHKSPALGALSFVNGKAAILSAPSSDDDIDVMPLPLPFDIEASDEVPLGFSRWSIRKVTDDAIIELWRSPVEIEKA